VLQGQFQIAGVVGREVVAQYLRRQAPEIRLVAADASPGLDVRAAIAGQLAPTSSADVLRLTLTMLDIRSGEIMARVQGDVHTAPSDLFPTSFDSESPVLVNKLPGQLRTDSLLFDESTKGVVSDTGVHGVVSDVWLAEAQLAYGAGHYEEALDLYKQAVAQPSVNAIRAYNGMYLSLMRLDRQAQATEAFKQLVAAGLSARSLGIKLLFVPGQTEFLPDPAVRSAYASWLQIIGSKVNASGICLDVVGHTSHTGTETFNLELSLMRGERVRDLLQADVPQLFTHLGVIGKGWTENIVGSGTDDARDAVDRRVEFRVVDCQGQSS